MTDSGPLVSIGLPTYNRAEQLKRAIESALAQDYPNLEVVISDNASTDETQPLCEELCRRDSRVRYIRQSANSGMAGNHIAAFKHARGDYYMVLGDDDWIDPSYVSTCMRVLLTEPEFAVVCGKPFLYQSGRPLSEGVLTTLLQETGAERVLAYYRDVFDNVPFYGISRRALLSTAPPMRDTMAGDWLYIASLAFLGKIKTVETTAVYKSVGTGASASVERIVQTVGLPAFQARHPVLSVLLGACKDIAWASPVYRSNGWLGRLSLSCKVGLVLSRKYHLQRVLSYRGRLLITIVRGRLHRPQRGRSAPPSSEL